MPIWNKLLVALAPGLLWSIAAARGATPTTLYTFTGGADGGKPVAALVTDGTVLYGTTPNINGKACSPNCGTLFKLDPATGTLTTLHTFAGAALSDGSDPRAALIYVSGILYGTTASGGPFNAGTVFKFDVATAKETVIHHFAGGMDGATPMAALTKVGGLLYSTTSGGGPAVCGAAGCGTVFNINMKSAAKQLVYGFHGTSDGQTPLASVHYISGTLYGTTSAGGSSSSGSPASGTVFTIDASSKLHTVLHAFTGGNDGGAPQTDLLQTSGMVYGTAQQGGSSECLIPGSSPPAYQTCGALFSVDTASNSFSPLGTLTQTEGGAPGPLSVRRGVVSYAAATIGGASNVGTIFRTDLTTGAKSLLYSFTGGADGAEPAGTLLSKGAILYGVTSGGGSGFGTVYQLKP
jgi:uncharacterized repeat protein (TIGR03803 family)